MSDDDIAKALENGGIELQRFMGGISGTKDCWTTAGSASIPKIAAVIRRLVQQEQAGWQAQHARDSEELRRLCQERDHLRRSLLLVRAESIGQQSGINHLSALVDDLRALLDRSMQVMKALHESAEADESDAMNAVIPAGDFAQFVDANAELMHAIADSPHAAAPKGEKP